VALPRCGFSHAETHETTIKYTWYSPGVRECTIFGFVFYSSVTTKDSLQSHATTVYIPVRCCCAFFFVLYFVQSISTTTIRCGRTLLAETLCDAHCICVHDVRCSSGRVFLDAFSFFFVFFIKFEDRTFAAAQATVLLPGSLFDTHTVLSYMLFESSRGTRSSILVEAT